MVSGVGWVLGLLWVNACITLLPSVLHGVIELVLN